jgi:hypothetical protein
MATITSGLPWANVAFLTQMTMANVPLKKNYFILVKRGVMDIISVSYAQVE